MGGCMDALMDGWMREVIDGFGRIDRWMDG